MSYKYLSGKGFQDSPLYYRGFEILRKNELRSRILIDLICISVILLIEMLLFSWISKF